MYLIKLCSQVCPSGLICLIRKIELIKWCPTISSLESSFTLIKLSHVMAPGYFWHLLLHLFHLFIVLSQAFIDIYYCMPSDRKVSTSSFTASMISGRIPIFICQAIGKRYLTFKAGSKCLSAAGILLYMWKKCSWFEHSSVMMEKTAYLPLHI